MTDSNKNSLFLSDQALVSALNRQIRRLSNDFSVSDERFLDLCQQQGITSILCELIRTEQICLPSACTQRLQQASTAYLALHLRRKMAFDTLHNAFVEAGIGPILLKGAAISLTLFPREDMRMRGDTDILVSPDEQDTAISVLEDQGFHRTLSTGSRLVFCEQQYGKSIGTNLHLAVDLHWALSNRQIYAQCIPHDAIRAESVTVDGYRCLSPVHALLHSVIHRLGHHPDEDRLIWQLDHYLLWQSLSEDDRIRCIDIAESGAVATLLRDEIEHLCQWSGLEISETVSHRLKQAATDHRQVEYRATGLTALRQDLSVLTLSRKISYLRELCFPSRAYMKTRYAFSNMLLLPWYYIRRLLSGTRKMFSQSGRSEHHDSA